jgi:hypothetical protein
MIDFIILPSGRIVNLNAVYECPPLGEDAAGKPQLKWVTTGDHLLTFAGDDAIHLYAALVARARPVFDDALSFIGKEANDD